MDIQLIVSVTLTILSTQAEICSEKQQCSNCSSITKQCITDCFPGYFDLKCKSPCSKGCKNSECTQAGTGIPKCSDGCIPGFYGTQCNIPCIRPRGNCTKCPQGCDGTFCHLTSSCVSGCHDSYYGSDCKTCSGRCRHCNRITGRCDECHDPYSGEDCQFSCEHCSTTNCVQACAPGLYGHTCSKICSESCVSYPAANTNHTVTSNISTSCTSECQRYSGECIRGRVDGIKGSTLYVLGIGLSTACILLVACLVFLFRRCRKTSSAERDNLGDASTHTERLRQVETEYYTLHRYWDIEDYDEVSQPPDQQQGPAEEDSDSDPALPVLADNFPGALDTEDNSSDPALPVLADYVPGTPDTKDSNGDPALPVLGDHLPGTLNTEDNNSDPALPVFGDYLTGTLDTAENISDSTLPVLADHLPGATDTEDNNSDPTLPCLAEYFPGAPESDNSGDTSCSSASGSHPYTHLMRDVIVDDPRTIITYISPTEDNN